MALILVSGPTGEPVTLAEAKAHLRVDIDDDDALIDALITTARLHLESNSRPQVAMMTQTWRFISDHVPAGDTLELRPYPLQAVSAIKTVDTAGADATMSAAGYLVDASSEPGRVRLKSTASWPSGTLRELNGFEVTFTAGYGDDGSDVPEQLRQALLFLVGHWYENREVYLTTNAVASEIPFTVRALWQPWRREQA